MPKPNMHPDNYVESSGALAGPFEVVSAKFKVHQANQQEGQEARGPVTALVLGLHPLNDDNEKIDDASELEIVLGLGGKSLAHFHPGSVNNINDEDPEDLGDEPGTEGNSIYAVDGTFPNAASSYSVFNKSLAHKGFDKGKIAACYAPVYEGLKFELVTVTPDKLEAYGSKNKPVKPGDKITYKVVQQIMEHPGKKAGKGGKAAAPAAKPAAGKKAAAEEDEGDVAETIALDVLTLVATKLAGQTKKLNGVKTFWLANYGKNDPKQQKAARDIASKNDWLTAKLEDLGAVVDGDEVTFAEAA